MIRVLHVIDTDEPGGAEAVFVQVATRLDPARFEPIAIIGGPGWLAGQFKGKALPRHIVPAKGTFNVRYLGVLLRLARKYHVDVILAHLYGSAVYASMAGALLSIPVISVLHGHTDVSATERFTALKSAIIRAGSRRVVFVSERLADHLEPHLRLSDSRRVVIPNGVDTEVFRRCRNRSLRSELGLSDDTILVGAIGHVRPPKAYDVLLRAACILINGSQEFHFVIVGDRPDALSDQLEQLSRALGIERSVTFLGLRDDVSLILNNLDVFVLSSHTEGFSIACIEAMACGVPVVATRSGGPEQILEGGSGLLVPTGDPESLALAIEQVVSSKESTSSMTVRAMQRVHERYSLGAMLSSYEDLLLRVVEESGNRPDIAGPPNRT